MRAELLFNSIEEPKRIVDVAVADGKSAVALSVQPVELLIDL